MRPLAIALGILLVLPSLAQQSPHYRSEEHTFNAGGHPAGGVIPASASFRITLHAIGDDLTGHGLTSVSYRVDGGFSSAYPPPGEVTGLAFIDKQNLVWDPERAAGVYNLYRDLMSNLTGLGFGSCVPPELTGPTALDGSTPSAGDGYFYLVTSENRIDEEGTKGFDSNIAERTGTTCP